MPRPQPADRDGELGEQEHAAEIRRPRGRNRDHRVAGLGERPRLRARRLGGLSAPGEVRDAHEHAILAIAGRLTRGLLGHGQDAGGTLARGLCDELLEPQAEARERRIDQERELVATLPGERAQRSAQPQPGRRRVAHRQRCAGVVDRGLPGAGGAREQGLHVHADQRGRNDAEGGQRRIASADVRVACEHPAEAVLAGEALEARAGVGDRDEVGAAGIERVEVREQRQRLDRAARLRGDDEQRPPRVDRASHGGDRLGVGRVEHVQAHGAGERVKASPEHLRGQRGAAHAEQHGVAQAVGGDLLGERVEVRGLAQHALGDRQPTQPVGDLRRAGGPPQRGVCRWLGAGSGWASGAFHEGWSQPLQHPRRGGLRELRAHRRAQ